MISEEDRKVFEKAKEVVGKDPKVYRQDPYGNIIYLYSHGKSTKMGWDVDHIIPIQRGGSNDIRNKQALSTHINRSKQDSLVKKSRHNNK
jgi:5-methylcytosine-specific restriction endonuclease McrA